MPANADHASKAGAKGDATGEPGAIGDLPELHVGTDRDEGVRGGATLPPDKQRQITHDTVKPA